MKATARLVNVLCRTWSVECLGESVGWYREGAAGFPEPFTVSPGGYLCL